jgi:hypothetical protein
MERGVTCNQLATMFAPWKGIEQARERQPREWQ